MGARIGDMSMDEKEAVEKLHSVYGQMKEELAQALGDEVVVHTLKPVGVGAARLSGSG